MSEPFIGEIVLFAGNFAPRGWAFCQGQQMSISQYQALFAILGITYGGNGTTTFNLPDLRGRVPVGTGPGPGLPAVTAGQTGGETNHTLILQEIPAHTHTVSVTVTADATPGSIPSPGGANLAEVVVNQTTRPPTVGNAFTSGTPANPAAIGGVTAQAGTAGGSQPHNNMQPYLGLNYIIALQGVFPVRN